MGRMRVRTRLPRVPTWWEKVHTYLRNYGNPCDLYVAMLLRDHRPQTWLNYYPYQPIHDCDTKLVINEFSAKYGMSCEVYADGVGYDCSLYICGMQVGTVDVKDLITTLLDGRDFPLETTGSIKTWMLPYVLAGVHQLVVDLDACDSNSDMRYLIRRLMEKL